MKPMSTPLDAPWFLLDRTVMAYKATETDILAIWRGDGPRDDGV
jgi:hypothetical protein